MKIFKTSWARSRKLRPALYVLLFAWAMAPLAGTAGAEEPTGDGPSFTNPRGISKEANGDLVVADFGNGNIYRVDGTTGDRELLSDSGDATQGPPLSQPAGIVVLPDGRIFVTDLAAGAGAVFQIDPDNGFRTLFAGGDDTTFISPFGIAAGVVHGKQMLVVADTGSVAGGDVIGPVLVDPDTGTVSQLKVELDNSIFYNDPRAVAVVDGPADDKNKGKTGKGTGRILVGNLGTGTIVSVHPVSGTRKIVSQSSSTGGPVVGDGVAFISVTDIATAADGQSLLVVDLGLEALIEVDLKTGDRTVITQTFGNPVGTGVDFLNPHGIEIVDYGIMITDFGLPGIVFVSDDGARTVFSATPVNGFVQLRDINVLADGDIVAADFGGEKVFLVDPATGERFLLSGGDQGGGPGFNGPVAVDELDVDTLAVAEFANPVIFFVDKATGDRSPLTGPGTTGRGTGPSLGARGFTVDPNDSNRILATDFVLDAVVAVDVSTGDRTIYSSAGTDTPRGTGPALNNPLGIAVAGDGTVYVSDIGLNGIWEIDAAGNRTVLTANGGPGSGITFARPFGVSWVNGEVLVADAKGIIRVETVGAARGQRTLVSAGGPLFTVRGLDAGTLIMANIGGINGIETFDTGTNVRAILSNKDNPPAP